MGTTLSTPSTDSRTVRSLKRSLPMTATTVRSVPSMTCSLSPISFTRLTTWSICGLVAPGFMTTIIGDLRGIAKPQAAEKKQPQEGVLRLLEFIGNARAAQDADWAG